MRLRGRSRPGRAAGGTCRRSRPATRLSLDAGLRRDGGAVLRLAGARPRPRRAAPRCSVIAAALGAAARAGAAAVQPRRLQLPGPGDDPAPRPQPVPQRAAAAGRLSATTTCSTPCRRSGAGTTAPYGPLFLGAGQRHRRGSSARTWWPGVLLIRLIELQSASCCSPSSCRGWRGRSAADRRRALWLALLSPLVMLELVAAGHNDVMMAGLLAAGRRLRAQRPAGARRSSSARWPPRSRCRRWPGSCSSPSPGARRAGPRRPGSGSRARATLGDGRRPGGGDARHRRPASSWLSTSLFSTPAKVRLAITPATAIGYTLASLLRDSAIATSGRGSGGSAGDRRARRSPAGRGAVLLYRVRIAHAGPAAGDFLLIAAAGGPAAWPWYFIWGLALVAAVRAVQRSPRPGGGDRAVGVRGQAQRDPRPAAIDRRPSC